MNPHFQYVLGSNRSEQLDVLAKTAARRYLQEGVALNDSIRKLAAENDLNPNQIERVCEMANIATHQGLWSKTAQKESIAFDLADARNVIQVVGVRGGSDAAPCGAEYMGPPAALPAPGPSLMSLMGGDAGHQGMYEEPERKKIVIVIQKHAAARKMLQDKVLVQGMELESLEKQAYAKVKQCALSGASFTDMYQAAYEAGLGKIAEEYFPQFEDRLIEETHGDVKKRLVKEAIARAPEDLISNNLGNITVINGAHPVLISLDTIQRKTGEIKNGLHNMLRIDDEIKVFTQRMRELS